jgi:hypothetical protein
MASAWICCPVSIRDGTIYVLLASIKMGFHLTSGGHRRRFLPLLDVGVVITPRSSLGRCGIFVDLPFVDAILVLISEMAEVFVANLI